MSAPAAAANLPVPQVETVARTHARSFLPEDARVNVAGAGMEQQFHDGGGDNLNYLVLESDHPLDPAEHCFHDELIHGHRQCRDRVRMRFDLTVYVFRIRCDLTAQGLVSDDSCGEGNSSGKRVDYEARINVHT